MMWFSAFVQLAIAVAVSRSAAKFGEMTHPPCSPVLPGVVESRCNVFALLVVSILGRCSVVRKEKQVLP